MLTCECDLCLSFSFRYPPRLGCCTNTPPPRACLCLSSHGQPESVCSPPVLPPADHVGLPVWSRSAQRAYITLTRPSFENRLKYSTILFVCACGIIVFYPQRYPLHLKANILLSGVQHCALTINPVQPGCFFFSFNKSSEPDGLLATK